ncbi:MAG: AAA family ATPase [Hamadaea sp.]|uniref:HelD family protein n=1 Tax=Hamadaea sp. TaxID=2024425 RepID=UPI001814E6CB|nr:UvrD-helicase domain-containing protein [Hamadaea sp.]NUT18002.1 AAA family ATPase [Hamadaea sp.]
MTAKATEIAAEQRYFDDAQLHWQRWISEARRLADAAADKAAARALKRLGEAQVAQFVDSRAVAVGRIDHEDGPALYIGRHLITDDQGEVLVVSWQADAAAPFHLAGPEEPQGLVRKRTFECQDNMILDYADVLFADLVLPGVGSGIDAALLAELGRRRDGALRDIVATIQAAQYELIRAPMDQLLVIEGGPGTGKTEIALHRVSWLLYHHGERLTGDDVLVIGPNPTFMRYISRVLPALGDADVPMRDVYQLAPVDGRPGRTEAPEVARLKGDARLAMLLARALDLRIGTPEAAERLQVSGGYVTLPGPDVADQLTACRSAPGTYAERRRLFRGRLTTALAERLGADPGPQPAVDALVERLWPQLTGAAFLRDLFQSRARLAAAAAGILTAEELTLLHRRGSDRLSQERWSAADLPLLDEADALINGVRARYAHVVVDEVQDLSPMQLRSIARRSTDGSMTIVGDLAQATGAWGADGWDEITRHLPDNQPVAVRPLRFGYRVPEQIMSFAGRLLTKAAPSITPPQAVQVGIAAPTVLRVGVAERARLVATTAQLHTKAGRYVGVICPAKCRREVEVALTEAGVGWVDGAGDQADGDLTLISPADAKGLEFDVVIVVEPEAIVDEDQRGHRMLYVAFTRATTELAVICVGEPLPLDRVPGTRVTLPSAVTGDQVGYEVARLAEYVAERIRKTLPEQQWEQVLTMVRRRLTPPTAPSDPGGGPDI